MKERIEKPSDGGKEAMGEYVLRPAIALNMLELAERYWEADRTNARDARNVKRSADAAA